MFPVWPGAEVILAGLLPWSPFLLPGASAGPVLMMVGEETGRVGLALLTTAQSHRGGRPSSSELAVLSKVPASAPYKYQLDSAGTPASKPGESRNAR